MTGTTHSTAPALPLIVLCGPIAAPGEPARGGYQACNRRTIEALRDLGVPVQELPFPHPRARGWRKMAEYAVGFLRLYARVLRLPRGALLHLTALSAHFIYLEAVLVLLARARGVLVLFDLRAGAGLLNYRHGTALYRLAFDSIAQAARLCLVEGEELLPFLREASGRPTYHFPNHLDTSSLPPRSAGALPPSPVVAYAGRIVPEKGIEVVLEACRALRNLGLAPDIRLAGEGDATYLNALKERYADLEPKWLGPLPSAHILELFSAAHFFVFPSRHHGEGQSNALTEAMACGCVPLVSRHGFNASVVGTAGVVLDLHAPPSRYAEEIFAVWRDASAYGALSTLARQRAAARFDTREVVRTLVDHYRRMARPPGL